MTVLNPNPQLSSGDTIKHQVQTFKRLAVDICGQPDTLIFQPIHVVKCTVF